MYDHISNIIIKELKKSNRIVPQLTVEHIYIQILYIKYLITKKKDNGELKKCLDENISEFYQILKEKYKITFIYQEQFDIKNIFKLLKDYNYKELLLELLEKSREPENERLAVFIKPKDKILYLDSAERISNYPNIPNKYTFISYSLDEKNKRTYNSFKQIDEMLGRKNTYYTSLSEVNVNDYDLAIINDTNAYYLYLRHHEDNMLQSMNRNFYYKTNYHGRIVLKTNFNKISKFSYDNLIKRHLSKVLFNENSQSLTVYMEFIEKNEDSISFILLNQNLINDNSKLQTIMNKNSAQNNVLLKIKPIDIINNNYRISFKMYQSENLTKVKEINDIVDANSEMTEELKYINKKIAIEIDELLERKGG